MKNNKIILIMLSITFIITGCSSNSNSCWSGTIGSEKCWNNLECQYDKGCLDSNGSVFVDVDGYWSWVCVNTVEYPVCK